MMYLLVMLAVSLALSSVGWKYFVYFFSVGYGFGIAALAVTVAWNSARTPRTGRIPTIRNM